MMVRDPVLNEHLYWLYWFGSDQRICIELVRVAGVDDPRYPRVETRVGKVEFRTVSAVNLFRDRTEAELEASSRLLSPEWIDGG